MLKSQAELKKGKTTVDAQLLREYLILKSKTKYKNICLQYSKKKSMILGLNFTLELPLRLLSIK